jgi:glucose uptake protein GlcU
MGASWEGFICAGVAVLCFGSNFVPVKKFETGDGLFFQWILCSGIWLTGLVVNLIQDSPQFEPIAMIGGVLWCTGNLLSVPIIKMIGMGLGLLIWGMVNLIMGWASGNFGLFGLNKQETDIPALNYVGVCVAAASVLCYAFVKPTVKKIGESDQEGGFENTSSHSVNGDDHVSRYLLEDEKEKEHERKEIDETTTTTSWVDKLSPLQKRLAGVSLSVVAGLLYGVNFDPPQWLIDHKKGSSSGLDYVFSHFCGIFLASTVYFLIYCLLKRNKPEVYPQIVVPGFISGVMWAIAQTCFFYANQELSFVVSFPIIASGPGAVGCLWGILLFGEIRGWRNFLFFGIAVVVNIVGVVLITLSKVGL